jgi:hypothetical protein
MDLNRRPFSVSLSRIYWDVHQRETSLSLIFYRRFQELGEWVSQRDDDGDPLQGQIVLRYDDDGQGLVEEFYRQHQRQE